MSKIRILCTADLHLGRSSSLLTSAGEIDVSAVGAWKRIVELAIREEADAVAIAGDVFDGSAGYIESRQSFQEGVQRLGQRGIPVVAVSGNHDYHVLSLVAQQELSNFHLLGLGGKWEVKKIETASGAVQFVGWSFREEHEREAQLHRFPLTPSHFPTVGVLHGDVTPKSPYHPVTLRELEGKADAWVLGHIHKCFAVGEIVRYPGSPQALDFGPGEMGIHGVQWLELDGGLAKFSETVPVSSVRYERQEVVVPCEASAQALADSLEAIKEVCRKLSDQDAFSSVQLRVDAIFDGLDSAPSIEVTDSHSVLGRHGVQFSSIRVRKIVDPWLLKDLNSREGEAARLLLGARKLKEGEGEQEIPESWVEAAKRLVDQSAVDIGLQFNRTLGNLHDHSEGAMAPPSEDERQDLAYRMLVEELEAMLEVAR